MYIFLNSKNMQAEIEEINQKIKEAESKLKVYRLNKMWVQHRKLFEEIMKLKNERELLLQPAQKPDKIYS